MEEEAFMSTVGWIFLALSWGLSSVLVAYCFVRVFSKR